ncbi:nitrate reductase gamma subunit [Plasticicumulans lactativorans]|uniref:nitrate reductase (quinone) n=1 Tax=Plasticicumulans lactativorans TaxID=1133106 RepID=A0A4R2L6H9_9GAMM|nr:respiratory nitrate reductase subunit gamma [Plasticicumulans lactativorans]TCO80887.1 nitrate reductase gamma subunit [Plasticicumulans lactativorans]
MSYLNDLLFGVYPYIAGTVFLIGSLVRFERDQYTWKAHSSQMLSSRGFRRASNLFHVGVLVIFVGHFFGLLTPPAVFHALGISAGAKQVIAIVIGGIAGVAAFIGLTFLVRRRLTDPRVRANSSTMDIVILLALYAQLTLGLLTIPVSLFHLDGGNMLKLMAWAQNIVTFDGIEAAAVVADQGFIFKLHLLLGMTIFLLFPFSRLVHIWSVPVGYVRRPYQVVRSR